jgi:hypothetical protein
MIPPVIDVNVKGQQLNIKAEEFVPNNSIEKDDNVTDVDNEVSLGNKPISDPRTDDSEKECNLPSKLDVVGRQLTRSDGVYIEGAVQGRRIMFTADTGAARTVISTKAFKQIPRDKQPQLKKSCTLAGADGQPLVELGKAMFSINLGQLTMERELIVADIEDDALLGLDILMKGPGGPADIKLTKGEILLNGTTIPCIQIGQSEIVRKVRSADDFYIPPRSEVIVEVFVDKFDDDNPEGPQNYLLEPSPFFEQRYPVAMAACLVEISHNVTNQVRLMNPFDHEVQIEQHAVLGEAEPVLAEPVTLFSTEDSEELNNYCSVRRIKLSQANPVTWQTNTGIIRSISKKGTTDGGKGGVVPLHLVDLYNQATEDRTEQEQKDIANLLAKYSQAFSKHESDLGRTNVIEYTIDTGDSKPIKLLPRRVPMAFAGEEKKIVSEMYEQGIIQKSNSPWSSPLVLVVKKNGKIRPCVDYRRLNAVTVKDDFPLPRIQDCLDTVRGSTLFSTFDLTSGYHQIPVKREDVPKTAFVTRYGLFEFLAMPFGVCNGPKTCQRLMEMVLNGLQWQSCLIYLDDVIVFSDNFNDHMKRLETVLDRMSKAGLKFKPEKCQLLRKEVTFLGHVVSEKGVQPNPDNIAKILAWPTPKTVTEVRQVLGMGSYYRRFIKDFSILVRPLTDLTKKSKAFTWTDECSKAFERLKLAFTSTEIMGFPKDEGGFYLDTDACNTAIGAVLSQFQDGQLRVIAYGSRTLNKAERNYCITDKELLAVRYFIEYYRQYLLGRKFCVRTDHQALIWLFSLKEPKGRIARWLEILSAFDFSVEYRAGPKHGNADTMSRCFNPRDCDCPLTDNLEYLKCGPCKKCKKRAQDMFSSISIPVPFTENILQPDQSDIPNEVDKVCIAKTRKQSAEENAWTPWNNGYSRKELQSIQKDDPAIGPILRWKECSSRLDRVELVKDSPATRHYWYLWDSLEITDELLLKQFHRKDGVESYNQFIVRLRLERKSLKICMTL